MGTTYRGASVQDRLNRCIKIANAKGGSCLSDTYVNTQTKMLWRCSEGHEWFAIPVNIVYKGKWCPYCSGNKRLQINDATKLATVMGGMCLSEKYKNSSSKLKWRCQFGHEWLASYNNVSRGSWCPYCVGLLGETVVRLYLERYFQKSFNKIRPVWLDKLELDGYCDDIGVAFEYNGPQHYDEHHRFYTKELKDRDIKKRKLCKQHGVILLDIPYIKNNDITQFILIISNKLYEHGFDKKEIKIYLKDIYPLKIIECKQMAEEHNGECLSDAYLGYNKKLCWKCSCGNIWNTTMYVVKKGHWCPSCGNKKKNKYRRLLQ